MGAPNVTYSYTNTKISSSPGFDSIIVNFTADAEYATFECRATKSGESWGVGRGALVASFSQTPANTARQFEIYDDYLLNGDGDYQITLYVQGLDGSWNDTVPFIPSGVSNALRTSDGLDFLCRKE